MANTISTKIRSDLRIITHADRTAAKHPAWDAFTRQMQGKMYGREALLAAWHWFKAGWEGVDGEDPAR